MEGKYYWLKVTNDRYELPLVVAESCGELAKACGVTVNTIRRTMWTARKKNWNSSYKKVLREGEEQ